MESKMIKNDELMRNLKKCSNVENETDEFGRSICENERNKDGIQEMLVHNCALLSNRKFMIIIKSVVAWTKGV
jgi:hypothetical protein